MSLTMAIKIHGEIKHEETIGTEDRIGQFADGTWFWQARGSTDVWFAEAARPEYADRDNIIAAYNEV